MMKIEKMQGKQRKIGKGVVRFPVTVFSLFLLAFFIFHSIWLEQDEWKGIMGSFSGVIFGLLFQGIYERFFIKTKYRFVCQGLGVTFAVFYYFLIYRAPEISIKIKVSTFVLFLAVFFAFLWILIWKSRISFDENFLAVFKAFFQTLFYAVILYAGCSLILGAIHTLVFSISGKAYAYAGDVVFVLAGPLYFLSRLPVYSDDSGEKKHSFYETLCPRFLEILFSYIMIPLIEIFSIVLVLYLLKNVRGEFWNNNLLEPMLLGYGTAVILMYLLVGSLSNSFVKWFRLVMPKVLIPIVLFQVAASGMAAFKNGLTYQRYFIILAGIFMIASGVFMILFPVRKSSGKIVGFFLVVSAISICPPIDAFTISRLNQENRLKKVLIKNDMLQNNEIISKDNLSEADKKVIFQSTEYLVKMKETGKIKWFPQSFYLEANFKNVFGFEPDFLRENLSIYVQKDPEQPITVTGYDKMIEAVINSEDSKKRKLSTFSYKNKIYILFHKNESDDPQIILENEENKDIVSISVYNILKCLQSNNNERELRSEEEVTVSGKNDKVRWTIIVSEANVEVGSSGFSDYNVNFYLLVQFL